MSVYLAVARHSFRRHSAYLAACLAGGITNTVFGVVRAYVLIALWRSRQPAPRIGGYDLTDAVTFCFVSQALIVAVAVFGPPLELSERIRTGDVAVDLHRPADLQWWWLADDLGRASFQAFARSVPVFCLGGLAFTLRLAGSPVVWLATAVSVLLAVTVSFALRYLITLSTFWLLDDRGVQGVSIVLSGFFSGLAVPLVLFPGWLGTLARTLPWAATVQVPADVFLGRYPGWHLTSALGFQLGWAVLLLTAGRGVTALARRRVVVQGG
ncbi:MAG TPA: ABC-2 family transporter protein [Mycobacteriales bacterium]|nr:ABC-2 family transporter protein [Mycobacteriales bacterium]